MLRIIAGKYRSRILEQPPLSITRPTIDRAREALFNIIQNNIENSVVLDCFAGSCTTGVAALKLKRNFMGCELDKEYFDKSMKRLEPFIRERYNAE